ncbi:MAG TPA: DinB family protein [Methylomirabilota bacterium]|nr:DinB family protein [Methylomirabilota bacterium]
MTTDRSYVEENAAELARLRALVDRLSDRELASPMPDGWTVAAVLAHLAFWDHRIVLLLDRWGPDGRGTRPPTIDETSVDWVNDAGKPLCLALDPRVAARMAVDAAVAADQRVAQASDALLAANAAAGTPISPNRAAHRREHLDEIERELSRR